MPQTYTERLTNPYTGKIETVTQDRPFTSEDFDGYFKFMEQESSKPVSQPSRVAGIGASMGQAIRGAGDFVKKVGAPSVTSPKRGTGDLRRLDTAPPRVVTPRAKVDVFGRPAPMVARGQVAAAKKQPNLTSEQEAAYQADLQKKGIKDPFSQQLYNPNYSLTENITLRLQEDPGLLLSALAKVYEVTDPVFKPIAKAIGSGARYLTEKGVPGGPRGFYDAVEGVSTEMGDLRNWMTVGGAKKGVNMLTGRRNAPLEAPTPKPAEAPKPEAPKAEAPKATPEFKPYNPFEGYVPPKKKPAPAGKSQPTYKPAKGPPPKAEPITTKAGAGTKSSGGTVAQAQVESTAPKIGPARTSAEGFTFRTTEVDPKTIGVFPGLQFKKAGITDAANQVSDELKGTTKFDQGAPALSVWERTDGKLYVIDGHHRRELAIRTKEPSVEVKVYREADGIDFAQARAIGALKNIRDGKGTALDAVAVLKDLKKSPDELQAMGLSTKSKVARDSVAMLRLSDEALNDVREFGIADEVAGAIAEAGLPAERQLAAIRLVGKNPTIRTRSEAQIFAEKAKTAGMVQKAEGDLFGGFSDLTIVEQAKITDAALKRLGQDKRLYEQITKGKATGGTVVDVDAQAQAAAVVDYARQSIGTAEDVVQLIEREAKEYAQRPTSKRLGEAVERVTAAAREATERRLGSTGGQGSAPRPSGGTPPRQVSEVPLSQPKPVKAEPVKQMSLDDDLAGQQRMTLDDPVDALREAAEVKTGGIGQGKRKGAATVGDPIDAIQGIAEAAKGTLAKFGIDIKKAHQLTTRIFGNAFDRLKSLGDGGKGLSENLTKVFLNAEHDTARLGFRLKESVKANFGRFYGLSKDSRTSLGLNDAFQDIVTKVEKRQKLTNAESRVWHEWATINKEIADLGRKFGVSVERVVGDHPKGLLEGKFVEWGANNRGRVKTDTGTRLIMESGEILDTGTVFYSEQLADPSTYFPRQLKKGITEKLADEGSEESKRAAQWLIDKKLASDAKAARKIIDRMLGKAQDIDLTTPVTSRLRIARTGVLLPDEFYNRNFLEVAERHISEASLDIAIAKYFGKNMEKAAGLMQKLPSRAHMEEAQSILSHVLGRHPEKVSNALIGKLAAAEGSYQAASKMGSIMTGIIQATQLASSSGILGVKPALQASMAALKDLVTGRRLIDEIKLSGVIDQDVLSLVGVDDATGALRTAANVATLHVKGMDRVLRVHAAIMGKIAAKDAVNKLRVAGGQIQRNAAYRLLSDWYDFTDADIVRMVKEGMSEADYRQAVAGGVKTQVRTRRADMPLWMSTPGGKIAMRFKTFSYGQARVFHWAAKEITKGNPVPALRLLVASAVVGEGVLTARDMVRSYIEHKKSKRLASLRKLWEKATSGDRDQALSAAGDLLQRSFNNALEAGTMGLYQLPIDKATKPYIDLGPPIVDTAVTLFESILYGVKSKGDFFDKLKAAGFNMAEKEVVVWNQFYKTYFGGGKSYRQNHPLKKRTR